MRKEIFLFFLIFSLTIPFVSSVNVAMKTDLKKGETLIAEVTGVFLEDIQKEDIYFYRRHLATSIAPYDVLKINNAFYIYAKIATNKIPDNYSIVIKNVPHMIGSTMTSADIVTNFAISGNIANFSIYPGALIAEEDYYFEVQNLQTSSITIEVSEDGNSGWFFGLFGSDSFNVNLLSGEIKQIWFDLENETKIKRILFESDNQEYNTTVYNIYTYVPPPEPENCIAQGNYCVEQGECSGNLLSQYECSGDLVCCDEPSSLDSCEDEGFYCMVDEDCSGNILNQFECVGTGLICCDKEYVVPPEPENCEDEGFYCMPTSACYGSILEQYECSGFFQCCSIPANQPASAYCGDGICNGNENCTTCSKDCGECPTGPYCGDGIKNLGEKCDLGEENGVECDNSEEDCGYCSENCTVIKLEKEEKESFWEKIFGKENKTEENQTEVIEDEEEEIIIIVNDEILNEEEIRLRTCAQLRGSVCETEQECGGSEVYAKDNLCCIGECKTIEKSNLGSTIGWILLGVVGLIIIWVLKKRADKKKKPVNLLGTKKR